VSLHIIQQGIMEWPNVIRQYQWTVLNRTKLFRVESYTDPKWYFTFEKCEKNASEYIERDLLGHENQENRRKALSMHIDMRYKDMPSKYDLSEELALFILRREILQLMEENCYGCCVDHPSQRQHMEGGCLMEWEDAVDMYFHRSLLNMGLETVKPYILCVCQVLDVSPDYLTVDLSDPSYAEKLKFHGNTDYDLLFE
jgi:hypothetical protein